jgi:hypothetical protein
MLLVTRSDVAQRFEGKSVAVVGSGPGVLDNKPGFIDGHDIVVRVNNYKLFPRSTGKRCDVHYSFYGKSITKTRSELKNDGVTLCMCKCPDAATINCAWHERRRKMAGVDFRWIYDFRKSFWFCETYIPTKEEFLASFQLLGGHVPTTGFSAILDVMSFDTGSIYLTGFDFFRSGKHNVNQRWRPGNPNDPIGHVPEGELKWLAQNMDHRITVDRMLSEALATARGAA